MIAACGRIGFSTGDGRISDGDDCPCTNAHGTTFCMAGQCSPTCDTGFSSCDRDPNNGCEADLVADATCGNCGTSCLQLCGNGVCIGGFTCYNGWENCNSMSIDGCEIDTLTDPLHCSGCGSPCALPNALVACEAGTCVLVSCSGGFSNCDGNDLNGCEAQMIACASCSSGSADCDSNPTNGCETNTLTSLAHCGGCNNPCAGTCAAGICN